MGLCKTRKVLFVVLALTGACTASPAKSPHQAVGAAGDSGPSSNAGSTAPADAGATHMDGHVAMLDANTARDANDARDASATPDANPNANDANDANNDDAGGPTTVSFSTTAIVWGSKDSPAGASFCHEDDLTHCAIADDTGTAVLRDLSPDTQYLSRVTKDGFFPEIKHFCTWGTDNREAFTRLIRRDVLERWATARGVTLDPSKGHIAFFALGGEGGDLNVSPPSGKIVNFNQPDEPDPALEQVGTSAFGLVLNVDPGMHDVLVTRPGYKCSFGMETGWPGSKPDISGVLVKPGLLSAFAFVICVPQSP